jgi:hypothetical protein
MKKHVILLLVFLMVFFSAYSAQNTQRVPQKFSFFLNGVQMPDISVVRNGDVLLADHEALSTALGSKVYFSPDSYIVTNYQNGFFCAIQPTRDKAMLNGDMVPLETPTIIVNNVYYTSVSFLCRIFEAVWTLDPGSLSISAKIPAHTFDIPPILSQFIQELETQGFIVQPGKVTQAFPLDYYAAGYIPDCNGNNATNPYFSVLIPPAPEQTFGNQFPFVFRLRDDEALVMVGVTPPECLYFGYRTYLMNRYYPSTGSRVKMFASLGDTINIRTVQERNIGKSVYEHPIILISTANPLTNERVRSAAFSAGYHTNNIFTDIIPADLLQLGLELHNDELLLLHRAAIFARKEEEKAFAEDPTYIVLRLTPKEHISDFTYATPPLKQRGSGSTEMALLHSLEMLQQSIIARFPDYDAKILSTQIWLEEGFQAIQNWRNVIGEVRDTLYLKSDDFYLSEEDEFIAVVGVNHYATGKSRYSNFSIYGAKVWNGMGGITNFQYAGTADNYLTNEPDAGNFYVWFISRKPVPGLENVYIVPGGAIPYGIPPEAPAFIGFRSYVEPKTGVGPVAQELVLDRVIHFTKKK